MQKAKVSSARVSEITNVLTVFCTAIIEIIATLTVEDQIKLWQWLGAEIDSSKQPWLKTVGIFQDDPHFEDVQHYIKESRQEIEEISETLCIL